MEHVIGDYIFESDKMIIFNKDIQEKKKENILSSFDNTCKFQDEFDYLVSEESKQKSFQYRIVQGAGIALSFNCGLRCNYCSQSSHEGMFESITDEDIASFIKDIVFKKVIASIAMKEPAALSFYFTGGGEPTYNWERFKYAVLELERQCQQKHVQLSLGMTTNGMLNEDQIFFISEHFEKVLLSYDGLPAIQNDNRKTASGKGTNDIVCNTLRRLIEKNVKVTIRTTIWQDDFKYLFEMFDYISNNFVGLYSWDINPVTPAGRATEVMKVKSEQYKETDFFNAFLKLLKYSEHKNSYFRITSPLLVSSPTGFNCGAAGPNIQTLWLLPNRKITTCIDSSDIITEVGCVKDGKINYYDEFEDPIYKMAIRKFEECRSCIAYRICAGGCPLKHIRALETKEGMLEWECLMQQNFWKHILTETIKGESLWGWKATQYTIEQENVYLLQYTENTEIES